MSQAKNLLMVMTTAVLLAGSLNQKSAQAHPFHSTPPEGSPAEVQDNFLVETPDTPRTTYDILGDRFRFLSFGSETGNKFTAFEVNAPVGEGVPQHIHSVETEVFYLIDGELTLNLHGETQVVKAGTYAYLPKGLDHGFLSTGANPAKILALAFPGGKTDGLTIATGVLVTDLNSSILPPINVEQTKKTALDFTLNFFPDTFLPYEGNETYHVKQPQTSSNIGINNEPRENKKPQESGFSIDADNRLLTQIINSVPLIVPNAINHPVCSAWGGKYTVLDNLEQTNGQYTFIKAFLPRFAGSESQQVDDQQDLQFYVVDGQVQFQVSNKNTTATPGSYVYLPKGTPFSFQNISRNSATVLLISSPSGSTALSDSPDQDSKTHNHFMSQIMKGKCFPSLVKKA